MIRKLVLSDLDSMMNIIESWFAADNYRRGGFDDSTPLTSADLEYHKAVFHSPELDYHKRLLNLSIPKNISRDEYTFYGKFDEDGKLLSFVAFKEWPSKTIMSILDVWVSQNEMISNADLYPDYIFDMINTGITDSFDSGHTSFYVLRHMLNTKYSIFDDSRCKFVIDSFEKSSKEIVNPYSLASSSIFTSYLDINAAFAAGAVSQSSTKRIDDNINIQALMMSSNVYLYSDSREIMLYHHVPKTAL